MANLEKLKKPEHKTIIPSGPADCPYKTKIVDEIVERLDREETFNRLRAKYLKPRPAESQEPKSTS